MEKALHQLGKDNLSGTEHLHDRWELIDEYPLSKQLLAMSNVWRSPGGDEFIIAAKGAPEAISDLCHLKEQVVQESRNKSVPLLKKNTPLPCEASQNFYTVSEGQAELEVTIRRAKIPRLSM
jgi:magnesium-transporting ATPase (P-type)